MVAQKGGCLRSWNGSHDLKRLVMRFVCFILLCFGTSTKHPIQSLDWVSLSFSCYLRCLVEDVLSWLFLRFDAKPTLSRSKCFLLIRLDLALHIVPQIRYLGFTQGRRVPWLRRRTCPLASPNEFWRQSTVNNIMIYIWNRPVLFNTQGME
jgi:hypothetical protein